MELMETSTTSHWVLRYNCRFTMPTEVTRSHSRLPDMPLEGTHWVQSELFHPISPKKNVLRAPTALPWPHHTIKPFEDVRTRVGAYSGHLGHSFLGCWMRMRQKRKRDSECCCWDCSQLITQQTDSALTLHRSLIFHTLLFTGPSACSTKVKWRERWHTRHTEIY